MDDAPLFLSVSETGRALSAAASSSGDYDPCDMIAVDRAIRHMPFVVNHLVKKAQEMMSLLEHPEDFRMLVATTGQQRARVYVTTRNQRGMRSEATDGVLLKAFSAMAGR